MQNESVGIGRNLLWKTASIAVKIISVFIIMILSSCAGPSDEDRLVLKKVEKKYSHLYTFEFRRDLFLMADAKKGTNIKFEELQEIYKQFFLKKDGKEYTYRDTTYVYLDVFNANGAFLYQIAYNDREKKFVKSNTLYDGN